MSRRASTRSCLVTCVAAALAGCFEAGPLFSGGTSGPERDADAEATGEAETGATGDLGDTEIGVANDSGPTLQDTRVEPDTAVAPDAADTSVATDAGPDSDAATEVDPGDGGDAGGDVADADSIDAGPVQACLSDGDCVGAMGGDACAGPLRCIDYGCRPDPAGAVQCPADGPCVAYACNPVTGLCDARDTCSCETPLALMCGEPLSWSSDDPGGRQTYAAFGCGPAPAGATMRLVSLAPSGRVRLTGGEAVAGLHVLEGACDPLASCQSGGARTLYFDAMPGAPYTLAVEERGPGELVTLRADCDIQRESACRDGFDDDADGVSDCDDRDCDGVDGCALPPLDEAGLCRDEVDNDLDGATDCDDPDCVDESVCLETCELLTGSLYCNYKQGLTNGSGKARSTHYSCNPVPQTAKEMVFGITAGYSGPIRIGFQGSNGLALHLLVETGRGCTPRDCIQMSTGDITFYMSEGTTYYLAVDGPGAAVGNFYFEIDCLE